MHLLEGQGKLEVYDHMQVYAHMGMGSFSKTQIIIFTHRQSLTTNHNLRMLNCEQRIKLILHCCRNCICSLCFQNPTSITHEMCNSSTGE